MAGLPTSRCNKKATFRVVSTGKSLRAMHPVQGLHSLVRILQKIQLNVFLTIIVQFIAGSFQKCIQSKDFGRSLQRMHFYFVFALILKPIQWFWPILVVIMNKPRTAKVGAISKAQNYKRGDSLGFVKLQLVAKYEKK